ncbi:MAG: RadC family protein [Clostridia bacterium]|nr:RadC family protein [Clostridia bacterium]
MHENHRARVRERYFAGGFENMDDRAVLEMLLFYCIPRKDTNPVAQLLLDAFGSLSGVLEASPDDLRSLKGIGDNAAAFLTMLPQVCKRYMTGTLTEKSLWLDDFDSVSQFIKSSFISEKNEKFMLLCFDGTGRLTNTSETQGEKGQVVPETSGLIDFARRSRAATVIIAHNHPDGVASPSRDDVASTKDLISAFAQNGITLADHFIVGADGILSMRSTERFNSIF